MVNRTVSDKGIGIKPVSNNQEAKTHLNQTTSFKEKIQQYFFNITTDIETYLLSLFILFVTYWFG